MDDIALCGHVFGAGGLFGPHCNEAFDGRAVRAAANPQFKAILANVLGHAVAHEAESDKADDGFLIHFSSLSVSQGFAA